MEGDLVLPYINVNVRKENKITSQWYQKPPDTGIMFNLLQNIKSKIQKWVNILLNVVAPRMKLSGKF